jgi:hypothetical protein
MQQFRKLKQSLREASPFKHLNKGTHNPHPTTTLPTPAKHAPFPLISDFSAHHNKQSMMLFNKGNSNDRDMTR